MRLICGVYVAVLDSYMTTFSVYLTISTYDATSRLLLARLSVRNRSSQFVKMDGRIDKMDGLYRDRGYGHLA